jgi:SSS family solute:Na+ symporter
VRRIEMTILDWLILAAYFLAVSLLGWARRSSAPNMRAFTVASAGASTFMAFASLTAAYTGPGFTLGLAAKAFSSGLVFLFVFLGFSIQTFLVGLFLAPRLNAYKNASTVGDVVGIHYGRTAQVLTGILSVLYCAGITGVVGKAAGASLHALTGTPEWLGTVAVTAIVVAYTARGGMKALVGTESLQFAVLAIGTPILLYQVWRLLAHTPNPAPLPPEHLTLTGTFPVWTVIGLFLSFLLGETLVPPYTARCFVTKEGPQVRRAFVWSSLFSVAWFAMVIAIGMMGRKLIPGANAEGIFVTLSLATLHSGLLGLIAAALASVIMSTQDAFLNAAAVSFYRDLVRPFRTDHQSDEKPLFLTRAVTVAVGALGVLFAMFIPGLIDGILACYTLWAPTVVIPLAIALFTRYRNPNAGVAAIIAGGLVTALWEWVLRTPLGLPSLVPGIAANLLAFGLVTKFGPAKSRLQLEPAVIAAGTGA